MISESVIISFQEFEYTYEWFFYIKRSAKLTIAPNMLTLIISILYALSLYLRNHIKINMGRLFFKDYREPRYEEYFQTEWRPKFFTNSLKELIREQNIHEIEIDVTHKSINLSEHPDCTLGIHTPYTYMTTGKICEYASEFQKVQKKFRPNIDCGRECLRAVIEYGMEDNRKWYRLGRTVYFENNCIRLSHSHENHETDEKTKIRMIYFPLNELVKEMAFSES